MIGVLVRYWPTVSETFVVNEVRALRARGVDAQVFAVGTRGDGALQDVHDLPVHYPLRGWRAGAQLLREGRAGLRLLTRSERRWLAGLRWKDQLRVGALMEQCRRAGVRRLHAHFAGEAALWGALAARALGVPFGLTVHAVDLFRPAPWTPFLVRTARPLNTVCVHHRDWLRRTYAVNAHVVHCGVDIATWKRADPGGSGPLRIVCVARYAPKKGVDTLVRAVEQAPVPVHLRLVSDAPARFRSERVEVLGLQPPAVVREELAAAQLFAMANQVAPDGDRDGVPVALLEAMAAGLPVLAGQVGGIPELVDDEVGWLVDASRTDQVTAALVQAATRPELRVVRAAQARQRVRAWSLDAQVDGLLHSWTAA